MGWETAIAAGISLIGSAVSSSQQRDAASYAEAAAAAQEELNYLELEREQRRIRSEANIQKADISAAAAAQGIEGSSLVSQSQQALETQLQTELDYLDQVADLSTEIAYYNTQSSASSGRASQTSSIFGAVGGIVSSIF